jgi:hypothetical protein
VSSDSPPRTDQRADRPDRSLPGALRWAVALIRLEGVALAVLAVFLIYEDLTGTANDLASALFVTGFAVGGSLILWLIANALAACRAGARAPAIVLQLLMLPIGWQLIQGGRAWLGVPLLATGLLIMGLLVSPATTRAMGLPVSR